MSVLETLAREHEVFRRLVDRLRGAGEREPEPGRVVIVQTLLVLLPALQKHDQIEDLVFDRPEADWPQNEQVVHRLVEAQHSGIRALRAEIEAVLMDQARASFSRLRRLAEIMGEKLSWHLETEEMLLWPLYGRRGSRALDASLSRRAEDGLRELKNAVARLEEGVEEAVQEPPL